MPRPKSFISSLLAFFFLLTLVLSHSWVEQLNVIAPNGTMIDPPGFPRGNAPRGAGFSDTQIVNLVNKGPDVVPTDMMCRPSQQNYEANPRSPRLQAAAGQAVALRYQENGHVTLPQNNPGKPDNRGTVFVYGTSNPQPSDTLMGVHRQWTADGKGGDGRGRLIATANYDDGQCYQVNGQQISQQRQQQFKHSIAAPQGADLWCQNDIMLPADLPAGKPFTLYWVWDWPTMPGTPGLPQGKQEIYSTCMDIDIVPNSNNAQGTLNAKSYNIVPQDIGNAAVASQLQQLGNANAVLNPAAIPFKGQPSSSVNDGGSGAPPPPPQSQGPSNGGQNGGPSQGDAGQATRPPDNGSRPPFAAAPGVFAGTPEFGTGSGTSISPNGGSGTKSGIQDNQQPPAGPAPTVGPIGRPGNVVTVSEWVTETVYKTKYGRNDSESTTSPSVAPASAPVSLPTVSSSTSGGMASVTTTRSTSPKAVITAGDVTYQTASVVTAFLETLMPPFRNISSTMPAVSSGISSTGAVKVVPLSGIAPAPNVSPNSTLPQVKPIQRRAQSSATYQVVAVTDPPAALGGSSTTTPPRTTRTWTRVPTLIRTIYRSVNHDDDGLQARTEANEPRTDTELPPTATAGSVEARSTSQPCARRRPVPFRIRGRAPLYILPDEVEEQVGGEDC
ncbi:uncharacterized protein AB675_5939 [Cyphellophora attinorum]|uniref:DUF7492 domain-containing protein n=1 Tax=Cyphellophora attinorum TaxID=1664694 RepID=A0A0N1H7L2_9EURO|nr:uncharacterized protein AB675_5939 [Phialophora attinorum]KPI38720.1 hypothetical protein AB675_5939 [Phialophora attinorum]